MAIDRKTEMLTFNEKTARNIRAQKRYDELMAIGDHGHYETMFRVIHEECELAARAAKVPDQPDELPSTYPMPEHGWTCFHCGETFKKPGAARDHFGTEPINTPACQYDGDKGVLMALRRTQDLLRESQKELALLREPKRESVDQKTIGKLLCQEKCAQMGEPPCHDSSIAAHGLCDQCDGQTSLLLERFKITQDRRSEMRYEIRDIETENGTRYQIWRDEEPVSYIFNKVSAAVRLMRRLNNESKGGLK